MKVPAQSLGQQLRHYRETHGWTRKEMAHAVGCAVVTLQKIERDERRPSVTLVQLLAQALHLTGEQTSALVAFLQPVATERLTAPPSELLMAPTILGRESELTHITALLTTGQSRLLTLTGPGGVGKTALATAALAALAPHFRDGVYRVELAALHHPTLVLDVIARAIALPPDGEQSLAHRLLTFLQPKQLLLYLDNLEHLLAAAPLLHDLLVGSPQLVILSTSREPLRLHEERLFPVPPLALPTSAAVTQDPLAAALASPAVALFVQRAQAVNPTFTLTAENALAVVHLCRQLDGLPLAIELVAARSRLLTPAALLARVITATGQPRIGLLAQERATLPGSQPARHRTLRETIDWSYQLLTCAEQQAFCRLALFAGGCTLAAAEALLHDEQETAEHLALYAWDLLSSLLDKSLLTRREVDGEPRFFMLATIGEYAHERLLDQADLLSLQRRYALYYKATAQFFFDKIVEGANLEAWLAAAAQEHDNFRNALTWAIAHNEGPLALATATALWRYWWIRGHWQEGRSWLEQALQCATDETTATQRLRARALRSVGGLCLAQGDRVAARTYLAESLALARAVADDYVEALALSSLATLYCGEGDFAQAEALLLQSMAYDQKSNNERDLAVSYGMLGEISLYQADYAKAERYLRQAFTLQQRRGDEHSLMITQLNLGHALFGQAQGEAAHPYLEAGLQLARTLGNPLAEASALQQLAELHFSLEQPEVAYPLLVAAFTLAEARGLPAITALLLRVLGEHLIKQGEQTVGAQLFGVCSALAQQHGILLPAHEQARLTQLLAHIQTHGDQQRIAAAYQLGQSAPLAESLALVHALCGQPLQT